VTHHPPVVTLPESLWHYCGRDSDWKEKYDAWAVAAIRRAIVIGNDAPIQKDVLGLMPYRPDLLAEIGPPAFAHAALRDILFSYPLCALALLMGFYDETAEILEPYLDGSGECVFHLLKWAEETGRSLRQTEGFYRKILVRDSYWGFLHARRTVNASLLVELTSWCEDERRNFTAAAAYFLLRHPAEAVAPYRELLLANPFYAYLVLPRLSLRSFAVAPEDIGMLPRWACHFGWSAFSTRRDEFIPLAASDPAWLVELAAGLGWLAQPTKLTELGQMISGSGSGHPLQQPAMQFLVDAKRLYTRPSGVAIV